VTHRDTLPNCGIFATVLLVLACGVVRSTGDSKSTPLPPPSAAATATTPPAQPPALQSSREATCQESKRSRAAAKSAAGPRAIEAFPKAKSVPSYTWYAGSSPIGPAMGSSPAPPDFSIDPHVSCIERARALLPGPSVSADGSLVVVPVVDDDGTRGYANLSAWFFDTRSGARRSTLTLLSVEESDYNGPLQSAVLQKQFCERTAQLERLLRMARVEPLVPVDTRGAGSEPAPGCWVTAKLRAEPSDEKPSLEIAIDGHKAFGKKFAWHLTRDVSCPAQFFGADVWISPALDVLLVVVGYSTLPDTCPSYDQYIVTTALGA
jgi:hypothetical protein